MGRTGKMYAYEHWDIEPDIVCLAKGIASGMPLGAIVARDAVMDWPSGSHASTFGGNPVSCRAALATLDLLDREYLANATVQGERLHRGLVKLAERHDSLSNPRGLGLMRAVDVIDPKSGDGEHDRRDELVQSAFERGLLLLGCGEFGLRFCPPLCITGEQVDTALEILDSVLSEAAAPVKQRVAV
jgi:4-aminobutyrate aminotransferase